MFQIKNLTVKNFMSVGNQTQAVNFEKEHLTLVLGANLDLGGDDAGSRNGTGKTTMINALSYALYGQALTNIKKENLINNINGKNMLVTVEFEKDGVHYKIERGRRPNILKLYINNNEQKTENAEDDAQGDSRETQKFIDQRLELSHTMFKHLLALNTYTEPFLSMRAADQREVIEQLLGITILSEKAEILKLRAKETRDAIQIEQIKIESIKKSNLNIQKSIDALTLKSKAWDSTRESELEKLAAAIARLESIDIKAELEAHTALKEWSSKDTKMRDLVRQKATQETALIQAEKSVTKYQKETNTLADDKSCPQCGQGLNDHKHQDLVKEAQDNLNDAIAYRDSINTNIADLIQQINELGEIGKKPITYYDSEAEALGHLNNLTSLERELGNKAEELNPYNEQITELKKTALQEIDWNTVNSLNSHLAHQEFLLKLLTNKDSFIRKKIIDQNLTHLNKRLSYYLEKLGLPHQVVFQNDLTVEIQQLGQDLDFDNLSRGERNRLILSMSFAFRDIWENLYQSINLLFVDELIDAGMDGAGVEAGLSMLKKMARERNKNIYLISHKEELIGRVNTVLKVVKENGFTSYATDVDYVETNELV